MWCWWNDTVNGKLMSTTNPTCSGLGSTPDLSSERLATNDRATAQHYSVLTKRHAVRSCLQLHFRMFMSQ